MCEGVCVCVRGWVYKRERENKVTVGVQENWCS